MNPRQMQQMMQRLGVQQQEVDAVEVIIRMPDKELVFERPAVHKVNMLGQQSWQITGEPRERAVTSPEDARMVAAQAGVDEARAAAALNASGGDIAKAILQLKA